MGRHGLRRQGKFMLKEFAKTGSYLRELKAIKALQPHPFVTEMVEHWNTESKVKFLGVIKLKFYDGCDIHTWIDYHSIGSELKFVKYVFQKVLLAYDYAVKQSIYHRDIKPENIMLNERGIVKLIDWELCSFTPYSRKRVGTEEYMAEEVHLKKYYHCMKSDVWSLAVVMFGLATGKRPYTYIETGIYGQDPWLSSMYDKRWKSFWLQLERGRSFPILDDDFKLCMQNMFEKNPEDRPTIEDLLCDDIFYGPLITPEQIVEEMQSTLPASF